MHNIARVYACARPFASLAGNGILQSVVLVLFDLVKFLYPRSYRLTIIILCTPTSNALGPLTEEKSESEEDALVYIPDSRLEPLNHSLATCTLDKCFSCGRAYMPLWAI